uniref:Armadillo repeat-containing protein 4 n=1 Tax=Bicosoecida sp. CB-2014 TaxID=1486930 RepID=A0A7S1G7H0_9STRA|mmetsp:Transcript_18786/g.66363  ORF Transcript_18786/g.66363 Transcript_18786/m.66363 type:complete len:584 (+) Transcript_18786:374-2125(+)
MAFTSVVVDGAPRPHSPEYDDSMDDADSGFFTTTTDGGSVFGEDGPSGASRGGSRHGGSIRGGAGGSYAGGSGGSIGADVDAHLGARTDAERALCVCRVVVPDADPGLGFLVRHEGRDRLMTTHALIDSPATAKTARVTFRYGDSKSKRVNVALRPKDYFKTDLEIGYTLVACEGSDLETLAAESLNLPAWDLDTLALDTPLTSVGGDAARRNLRKASHRVRKVKGPFFWYTGSEEEASMSVSEGAPLFRNGSELVGLHLGFDEDADLDWGMQLCAATAHIFLPRVVKLMRERRAQAVIQSRGSLALAYVSYRSEPARVDVVESGGVSVIVAGLRRHMTEVLVVQQACGALGNIAAGDDDRCQDSIIRADGIRALVDALQVHMADPRVAEGCLRAFANIAVGPDARKQKMIDEKALSVIVQSMDMHGLIASIQEAGCRSLASISFGSNKRKDTVIEAGGPRCVVRAMTEHPDDGTVQLNGVIALLDVAAGGGTRTAHVHEVDGVRVLVDAMRAFPASAKIQEYACMALWNIAGGDKDRRKRVREAASGLPRDVRDRFDDNTGVQEASKDLIKRLDGKDRCSIM